MEQFIKGVITDNYNGFLYEAAQQARHYFRSHDIRLDDVVCAMPGYIHRNMYFIFATYQAQSILPHPMPEEITDLYGIKVVDGYEEKLVFYCPEWFYNKKILPLIFDIPEQFKIQKG